MTVLFGLLIGLGVFLLGMALLEQGITALSRAKIKHWFYRYTSNPISSTSFGIISTAALQSSSMVSLLVLAFASASVIPLYNAIGIILGANLGTTFTGWIVTTIGFKLDLETLALPLIALAGIFKALIGNNPKNQSMGTVFLGLGLLILGLNLMKEEVAFIPEVLSLDSLANFPPWIYLLIGIVISAIIQSSSAVMMMTLAALHSDIIMLADAAALIIGADLGTTSTTVLGSITGNAIKKRLALAHCLFNIIVDLTAFFILLPLLPSLLNMFSLSDPLYSLVAFHSMFNFFGILLFLPFLKQYANLIDRTFQNTDQNQYHPLRMLANQMPEAVLPSLINITKTLYLDAINLILNNLKINISTLKLKDNVRSKILPKTVTATVFSENYAKIKSLESEILELWITIEQQELTEELSLQFTQLLEVIRGIIYSCKTHKDIHENLIEIRLYESTLGRELHTRHCDFHKSVYASIITLLEEKQPLLYSTEEIERLFHLNDEHKVLTDELVYHKQSTKDDLVNRSSMLNINREIHHATNNLLKALTTWLIFQEDEAPPVKT